MALTENKTKEINIGNHKFLVNYEKYQPWWDRFTATTWEKPLFEAIEKLYSKEKCNIFLDIGSWVGTISLFANSVGYTTYSFEPDPTAFKELESNITLNKIPLSKIFNIAITDIIDTVDLYSNNADFGYSSSGIKIKEFRTKIHGMQKTKVQSITFDRAIELIKVNPDFIKIDIEGAEEELLEKSLKDLAYSTPTIYLECHGHLHKNPKNFEKNFINLTKKYDYIFKIVKNSWVEQENKKFDLTEMQTYLLTNIKQSKKLIG